MPDKAPPGRNPTARSAAEVVDQRVIPIAEELAENADTRAANIDPVIEALRNGCRAIGMIIITADVEMHAAGDRNAILIIRGANGGPVIRHGHDHVGWHNRTLDWIGRIGVRDLGIGLGIGFRRGCRIRGGLLLQIVELLLHQSQLLFQQRDLRVIAAGRLCVCLRCHQCSDQAERY
jgi:hypothetical protein